MGILGILGGWSFVNIMWEYSRPSLLIEAFDFRLCTLSDRWNIFNPCVRVHATSHLDVYKVCSINQLIHDDTKLKKPAYSNDRRPFNGVILF